MKTTVVKLCVSRCIVFAVLATLFACGEQPTTVEQKSDSVLDERLVKAEEPSSECPTLTKSFIITTDGGATDDNPASAKRWAEYDAKDDASTEGDNQAATDTDLKCPDGCSGSPWSVATPTGPSTVTEQGKNKGNGKADKEWDDAYHDEKNNDDAWATPHYINTYPDYCSVRQTFDVLVTVECKPVTIGQPE